MRLTLCYYCRMNYRLKSGINLAALLLPELFKRRSLRGWLTKQEDMRPLSNLLTWRLDDSGAVDKILRSFSKTYDVIQKVGLESYGREWWFQAHRNYADFADFSICKREFTQELKTLEYDVIKETVRARVVNCQKNAEPVPGIVQVTLLEYCPELLPRFVPLLSPELVMLHAPDVWSTWQHLEALYGDQDQLLKEEAFRLWLLTPKKLATTQRTQEELPNDFD